MIEARNLTKIYGDLTAVRELNLEIKEGEVYCLLGPNGAGKTTTVNLFMGFVAPSDGKVFINGMDVSQNARETKRVLSYIPENLALYPNLTGLENLEFFAGLSNGQLADSDLKKLLNEAGLQQSAFDQRVSGYSKGMRQKVGIAIALAKDSKALILDEPTSGLDPQASNEFARLLGILSEKGVAILMTTHDLFRARETGTRIGIMRDGVLRREFNAGDVKHDELEQVYLEQVLHNLEEA
ncbi:MAG: ABC transporter ATP-binding protein [Balneolaceae bacterium]|nr:ABC transporter ATP-binding protein [Balneolaceae bacterium]MCH8548173.1 ABC transporter ATP-binding protein [Balneolaceae bacterium]